MKRPARSSFAPRAEVFPGGSVDAADLNPEWSGVGGNLELRSEGGLHHMVTAVRETFEECGVLIARDALGLPCPPTLVADLAPLRHELHDGHAERFLPGLREFNLRPGWEDLAYCAHWVTPEGLPRIFDTRFFMAALPAGQEPSQDGQGELESMRWITPHAALGEAAQGEALLLPPTRSVLSLIASAQSVADALRLAREVEVQPVQPRLEDVNASHYPGLDSEAVFRPIRPGDK